MSPDVAAAFAIVILMAPMAYFFFASPSFLFVKLDIPPVAELLRGMFRAYFLTLIIAGVLGTAGLAVAGRLAFVLGIAVVIFALLARQWFLHRIDAQIATSPPDAGQVAQRLRRLHVAGMLCNAIQFAAVLGSVPFIMPTA